MNWLASIDTVLFDLDGTLTVPVIDFPALRKALGIAGGASILHALDALSPHERAAKEEVVRKAEMEAALKTRANEGAAELVGWLHERAFATAIITRNNRDAAAVRLGLLGLEIAVVLTRESVRQVKPAPEAVTEALRRLGRRPDQSIMVGDWHDDVAAGKAASTRSCLITNGRELADYGADLTLKSPRELLDLLKAAHGR